MSDVPYELVREILVKLPAESLLCFRSVCKTWLRIIDDPFFIKAHNNNQLYTHTLVVATRSGDPLYSFSLESLNFISGHQSIDAIRIQNLEVKDLFTVASCNGLILISIMEVIENLVILNPLTRECQYLPKPDSALNGPSFGFEYDCTYNRFGFGIGYDSSYYGFGFGYDPDSDDYKFVVIHRAVETLIYSLNSDSWRRVEDCPCVIKSKGAFLDGALYWAWGNVIIALNLGTEKYCQLPLPPSPVIRAFGFRLDAFDGCLICSFDYADKEIFDGWVMEDDGVEKSWTKLFSLQYTGLNDYRVKLVAYLKRKEQVVLQHSSGFLWFDIGNYSVKKFNIQGLDITSSQICPGSLVRLNDYRGSRIGFGAVTDRKPFPRKRKRKIKTKITDARLMFCVRNAGEMCCCSDNYSCSEDSCWRCKEDDD